MMSSVCCKSATTTPSPCSDIVSRQRTRMFGSSTRMAVSPERSNLSLPQLRSAKSHHLISTSLVRSFGVMFDEDQKGSVGLVCRAYEAEGGGGGGEEASAAAAVEAAKKAKIGVYFATWWALNVVFNIYNKKVLNAFPFPWLTSTLSLAAGSLIMIVSWATS